MNKSLFTVTECPLDSEAMNLQVARVDDDGLRERERFELALSLSSDHDLIYYTVDSRSDGVPSFFERFARNVSLFREDIGLNLGSFSRFEVRSGSALHERSVIEDLASECLSHSHLNADSRIDVESASSIYRKWIDDAEMSLNGRNIALAEINGRISGMIVYTFNSDSVHIDLLSVAREYRRLGCGRALAGFMFASALERGIKRATVVTQSCNSDALSFYMSEGFTLHSMRDIYHVWSDRIPVLLNADSR